MKKLKTFLFALALVLTTPTNAKNDTPEVKKQKVNLIATMEKQPWLAKCEWDEYGQPVLKGSSGVIELPLGSHTLNVHCVGNGYDLSMNKTFTLFAGSTSNVTANFKRPKSKVK